MLKKGEEMKGFTIVKRNNVFRLTVIGMDKLIYHRNFNKMQDCFKWLKMFQKHERTA